MPPIDARTLSLIAFMSSLLLTVGLLLVYKILSQERSVFLWVLGAGAGVAGFLLFALRGVIPDLLSIVLANVLLITGLVSLYLGNQSFMARQAEPPWYWFVTAATAALLAYFTYVNPSLAARTLSLSAAAAVVSFASAWQFLSAGQRNDRGLRWFIGAAYFANGLFMAARLAIMPFMTVTDQDFMTSNHAIYSLSMVFVIALDTVLCIGLPLLVSSRQQRHLLESEERFRSIVHNSTDAVFLRDAHGKLIYASPMCERVMGYPHEFFMGKARPEIVHPQDRALLDQAWEKLCRTGEGFRDLEFRVVLANGVERWLSGVAAPFHFPDGTVGLQSSVHDIDQLKRTQIRLKEESERNQAFLRSASDGVHILDADGKVLEVSDSFCEMLGYARDELIGAHVSLWDAQRSAPELTAMLAAQLSEGGRSTFQTWHRRKDGSVFPVEVSGRALELEGQPVLFNSARDTTVRQRALQALDNFFERSANLHLIAQLDGVIVRVNEGWQLLLGYAPQELLATNALDLIHPDDKAATQAELVRLAQGISTLQFENRYRHKSGGFRLIAWSAHVSEADQMIYAVGNDITEARGAEDARRRYTQELLAVNKDLTRFNEVAVGRELRMVEVKQEVNALCRRLGEAPHYGNESMAAIGSGSPAPSDRNAGLQAPDSSLAQWRVAELNLLEDAVASQRKAEASLAALRESEEIFTHFMDNSPIYVFFKDQNMRALRLSRNYEDMLGKPVAELLGKNMDELFPSDFAKSMVADDKRVLREGQTVTVDEELNGRFYSTIKFPIMIGGVPRFLAGYTIDITERRAAEAKIARLTRLYAALSQCNEAIVRCTGEAELFAAVCRIAVQSGGMKMAWIGLVDPLSQAVQVKSCFGDGAQAYLDEIRISTDAGTPLGRGPTGTSVREDRRVWCQDFGKDPLTAPWHDLAARMGFCASASLPLHCNAAVIGTLTLYSGEINAFDEAARELLENMAADISFALDKFEQEAQRQKAQDDLRTAEAQFRGIIEQNMTGIYITQETRIVFVNERLCEMLGWPSVDLLGKDTLAIFGQAPESERKILLTRKQIGSGVHNVVLTLPYTRPDARTLTLEIGGNAALWNGRPAIIGMVQDISEKQRAEQEIRQYVAELKVAFMSSVEVATRLSELRDPYTAGHERRVAEISVAIGAEMGLDARRQEGLRVAGHLHDVGQITVPAEVLSKPGKLSAIAYRLIQTHAQAGYDVLKGVKFPWPVAEVALQHHERMDGSGYPQGLKGDAILLEARIVAVADVLEAMASHRPYRPALGIDKALAEIEQGRGHLYDPQVADACLRLFREKGFELPA